MSHLLHAIRVAIAIVRSDVSEVDRFDLFASQLRAKRPGAFMSEGELREAYLQWRLSLESEQKASFLGLRVARRLVSTGGPKLTLVACALVLGVVLYPPFYLEAGGQSVHLGFGFAFTNHPGRVDVMYLALELASIGGIYWLMSRYLTQVETHLNRRPKS